MWSLGASLPPGAYIYRCLHIIKIRKSKVFLRGKKKNHHEKCFFVSFLAEIFLGWSKKIRIFLGILKGDPPKTAIFDGP